MKILRGHETNRTIWGLAFSPDSERLVSSSWDNTIRLWDLTSGQSQVVARASSSYVSFSPDGSRLVYNNRSTTVMDLESGESIRVSPLHHSPQVFSRDGSTLIGVLAAYVVMYDSHSGERTTNQLIDNHLSLGVFDLCTDNSLIAFADHYPAGYTVHVRTFPALKPLSILKDATASITALAFSPNGRLLAAASERTLLVWEVANGIVVLRDRPDTRHFKSVAFSPDGQWLAAAHNDNCVRLYSTQTWAVQETLDWGIGPLVAVRFAPDGMRAAASSKRGKIVVWDVDP